MNQASVTTAAEPAAVPRPTFDALPLSGDVRKALDTLGYENPTPVQLAVFEPASRGKSLVVQARTGTGKTAAFGLPVIDSLVRRAEPGVQALILTPTRELALQVARELERIAQFRGTKVVAIYGGAPIGRQVAALEEGAQVVVGTPGRVLDHLRRGTLDPSGIRVFVLDEADEMLSMGFQKELNAIIETLPKDRQGLYFSATIPPDVERLANNHLRDPEYVTLSSDQIGALEISHFVYLVREGDKRAALARVIEVEDPESAVIFCNTKDETERVAEALKSRGYDADWLNGDLEQRERERVMSATREGKLRFLVATDVAARGIDISHLTHVINADFPESAEQYVHRTGRTGRAGRTGTAISMVGPKDVGHLYMLRLTYKIRPVERMLPTQGELRTRAEADMIAFLADAYAGKAQDPGHLAIARRLLTHDSAAVVIAGLLADHLGATSGDASEEAADARRAKNPAPVPSELAPSEREAAAPAKRREEPRAAVPPRAEGPSPREVRANVERSFRNEPPRTSARTPGPDQTSGRGDRAPRTLRDGEPPAKPSAATPAGTRGRDDRGGERRERRPQSALSDWEPPVETDDDAPLFRENGTSDVAARPNGAARADGNPSAPREPRPSFGRDRDRDRGGRRGGRPRPSAGGEGPGDLGTPLPQYQVSDAPAPGFESKPREEQAPRTPRVEQPPRAPRAERSRDPLASPESSSRGREEKVEDDPSFTNVFLNVGKRDGLRVEDVQKLLLEKGGLAETDVGHIRLRDRITFVGIRKEHSERAIQGLIGAVVGDRTVNAEPARER